MTQPVVVSVLVFIALCQATLAWINPHDNRVIFQCPKGEHISRIKSQHQNYYEDRQWDFECTKGYVGGECKWQDYANNFDKDLDWQCPDNGLVTGFDSYHSNHHEDRRWKFRCCKVMQ